jgi:hypothetical protein
MAKAPNSSQSSLSTVEEPFISRNFFSYHYLKERLPKDDSRWSSDEELNVEAFAKVKELYKNVQPARKDQYTRNEANLEKDFIRPILDILGHNYDVQESVHFKYRSSERPDYTLFPSEVIRRTAQSDTQAYLKSVIGLGEAKAWDLDLDKTVKISPTSFANPSLQINNYLRDTSIGWGILTNGRKWRLYNKETSLQLDSYYEIDLAALVEHGSPQDFKYFYMFFRKESFISDASGRSFLEDAFTGSVRYARELEEDVKENVYEALSLLIKGFLDHPDNKLQATDIQEIHENSLILLYRLLFILYAEAKGLLPLKNSLYGGQSLQRLREDVEVELNKIPPTLTSSGDSFWSRLVSLFRIIDVGSEARGISASSLIVPPYNGGLFDPQKHPFLEKKKVGDVSLARALHHISWSKGRNGHAPGFVDYTSLSIRHLGSIYEGLLEYKPMVADEDLVVVKKKGHELLKRESELSLTPRQLKQLERIAKGEVYLRTDKGDRKATGSYYTPDYVVKHIVEEAIGPLVDSIAERGHRGMDFVREVLLLKVLDPAMGSGHFLVEATSFLAVRIVEALAETDEGPRPGGDVEVLWARREVARRCIYGVDLNPLAVELSKVSLWLHTVTKDKPLSFLDHHLKCGNSLLGIALADLKKYPLESERKGKKDDTTLPSFISQIFIERLIGKIEQLDVIGDDRLEDIKRKEQILEEFRRLPEYEKTKSIADVYLSASFGNVVAPVGKRTSAEIYYDLVYSLDYPSNWAPKTKTTWFQNAVSLADERRFFHWELEFPEVFFEKGGLKHHPGFDAVVGNPPYVSNWQLTSLDEHLPDILASRFPSVSTGHWDLYILFIKRGIDLSRMGGAVSYIVPNSLATEKYGVGIRGEILSNCKLSEIVDFGLERPFGDVARQFMTFLLFKEKCDSNNIHVLKTEGEAFVASHYVSQDSFKDLQNCIIRFDITETDFEIKKQVEKDSVLLGNLCCVNVGVVAHSREGSPKEFTKSDVVVSAPSPGFKRFVAGDNIGRYGVVWSGQYMNYADNATFFHRPKFPELFENPKIIVRRVSGIRNRLLCHLDTEGYYSNDNVILVLKWTPQIHEKQNDGGWTEDSSAPRYDLNYILAIMNSSLMGFYFSRLLATDTLQSEYTGVYPENVRAFPIRRISARGHGAEERVPEREFQEVLFGFYGQGGLESVKTYISSSEHRLWRLQCLLAFLSSEMTRMNKEKQSIAATFLNWIESDLGLGVAVGDLGAWSEIKSFWMAPDLGSEEARNRIESLLANNKVTISSDKLSAFRREYTNLAGALKPIVARISSVDSLIDVLVYDLYELSSEQVDVVESAPVNPSI